MKINVLYGPPGTGKTRTIINEILVKEIKDGTPLGEIAVVTFTKKAATEVKDRMRSFFSCSEKDLVNVGTIHSMAFRATGANTSQMMNLGRYKDFGSKSGFSLKGYYSVDEGFTSKDDDFIGLDQLYRNNKKYCQNILDHIDHKRFVTFMTLYRKYKDTFNFLDFTDLLSLYIEHKHEAPVRVAIIDEAQDLTTLQWHVVMRAFRHVDRLYIAGDDDQAIFSFAGADIQAFLRLKGESRVLEHSFRLPQLLVNKAKRITDLMKHRVDKIYNGDERESYYNRAVDIYNIPNIGNGESWYLLARNNAHLKEYIDFCTINTIPFSVKGEPYVTKADIRRLFTMKSPDPSWDTEKILFIKKALEKGLTLDEDPLVNISTIHGVKGGEADNVVISSDVSKGVHKQLSIDEDSEHRVFYVGITRAKKQVIVLEPSSKYHYPYL